MPGNTGTIKIALQIDDKGSVKILKNIGSESHKTGKKGKDSFDKMDKGAKNFSKGANKASSALLKIGGSVAALVGVTVALKSLVGATKEYVQLAGVQETAETDLQAVLESTGHAAGYNLAQLKAMASGMQNVTTVGDETTLSGMAILATFKQVRGEGFERSTMAAMDMAQVMKTDLKSSMTLVGKAVNDPIKGLSALTRVGVTFTDGQKDTIKSLQESGDMMGAQGIILAELESQFGGAAKAASQTFTGGMTQAGNALGDVKEELGFVITKNQFFIELTHLATQEFTSWGEKISDNREYLMQLAKDGVLTVVDALGVGIETLRFFHNGWLGIKLVGNVAVAALAVSLAKIFPLLRGLLAPLDAVFEGAKKLGMIDVNPFDAMANGLAVFKDSSADVTREVIKDIEETNKKYDTIKTTINGWKTAIEEIPVTQAKTNNKIIEDNKTLEKKTKETVSEIDWAWEDQMAAEIEYSVKSTVAAIKEDEKREREAKRTAAAIASATAEMYQDIGLKGLENYNYQKGLLKAQVENYKTIGVEIGLIKTWEKKQNEDLYKQMILDSDDFFAGMKIGLKDSQKDFKTWAEHGAQISKTASQEMQRAFSDTLFLALKGDIDDISQVWDGFMDSMLHKLTDTVADMAVQWGIKAIGSAGTTMGWWDTGAWEVKKDHVAMIHKGEMVVPADIAAMVRGEGNPRSGASGSQISDLAQVSPSGGHEWTPELAALVQGTKNTYVPYALQGLSLFAQNQISSNDLMSGLLSPEALATSVLTGGIPSMFNEYLGMNYSKTGKAGQNLFSAVGGQYAGVIGAMLGGMLGGTVGTAVGDLFNARGTYESYFDLNEDHHMFDKSLLGRVVGWFSAQQGNASLSKSATSQAFAANFASQMGIGNIGSISNAPGGFSSYGGSSSSSYGGGGYDDATNESMGLGGFAKGGIVDRLMLPRGEDGWAPVQFGEGFVSKKGMGTLDRINSGSFIGGNAELIAEIRKLRAELRAANYQNIKFNLKTARYTELSYRKEMAT